MEETLRGSLLVASPALVDPNFARSVVFITEHNDDGAMGIVLDRPSDATVGEIAPQLDDVAGNEAPIYVGGPVQPSALVVLAEFSDPSAAAWIVVADVGFASADVDIEALDGLCAPRARIRGLFRLGSRPARGRDGARTPGSSSRRCRPSCSRTTRARCGAVCWPGRAANTPSWPACRTIRRSIRPHPSRLGDDRGRFGPLRDSCLTLCSISVVMETRPGKDKGACRRGEQPARASKSPLRRPLPRASAWKRSLENGFAARPPG